MGDMPKVGESVIVNEPDYPADSIAAQRATETFAGTVVEINEDDHTMDVMDQEEEVFDRIPEEFVSRVCDECEGPLRYYMQENEADDEDASLGEVYGCPNCGTVEP